MVLSLTLPDSSTYTFGRDVNLLWKHGILAEKPPSGASALTLTPTLPYPTPTLPYPYPYPYSYP